MRFSPLPASVPESKFTWIFLLTIRFLITSLLTSNLTLRTADAHDLPADWSEFRSGCFSSAGCNFNNPSKRVRQSTEDGGRVFHNVGILELDPQRTASWESLGVQIVSEFQAGSQRLQQFSWDLQLANLRELGVVARSAERLGRQFNDALRYQCVRVGDQVQHHVASYRAESKDSYADVVAEIDDENCELFLQEPGFGQLISGIYGVHSQDLERVSDGLRENFLALHAHSGQLLDESRQMVGSLRDFAAEQFVLQQPIAKARSQFKPPMFVTFETADGFRFLLTRRQAETWDVARAKFSKPIHAAVNSWGAPCMAR